MSLPLLDRNAAFHVPHKLGVLLLHDARELAAMGSHVCPQAAGGDLVEEGRRLIVARGCERDLMVLAPLLLIQLHRL